MCRGQWIGGITDYETRCGNSNNKIRIFVLKYNISGYLGNYVFSIYKSIFGTKK